MKPIKHNGKTLIVATLAIGCMGLVLLWPDWRAELQALEYPMSCGLVSQSSCFNSPVCQLTIPPILSGTQLVCCENTVNDDCTLTSNNCGIAGPVIPTNMSAPCPFLPGSQ
jgi:hypothetical protein